MKRIILSCLCCLILQTLFSQNYLIQGNKNAYEMNWLYRFLSDGWDNSVSIGYNHAGRLDIAVGIFSEDGLAGDIILETSHFFDFNMRYAILQQGIKNTPLTLNVLGNFKYGGVRNQNKAALYQGGIGIYKRFDQEGSFAVAPGLALLYFYDAYYGYGFTGVQLQADFLFGKVKLSPHLELGRGIRAGVGLGFLLPQLKE